MYKPFANIAGVCRLFSNLAQSDDAIFVVFGIDEASACMSRRCLQGILLAKGYNQKNLAQQINVLLAETDPNKILPQDLAKTSMPFGILGISVLTQSQTSPLCRSSTSSRRSRLVYRNCRATYGALCRKADQTCRQARCRECEAEIGR
jgi:hypothetical protein